MGRTACAHVLTPDGWRSPAAIEWDNVGIIQSFEPPRPDERVAPGWLIPGVPNVHSHSFQRAFVGQAEMPGPAHDNFWSWRKQMYRVAARVSPELLEAISALLYMEMLEAGYTSVGEFHYLHRRASPSPAAPEAPLAMHRAIADAARRTGIALTLLPVFYAQSDFGQAARPEQRLFTHPSVEAFLDTHAGLSEALGARPNLTLGMAAHSLRAITPGQLAALLDARAGAPFHIHISEQPKEVAQARRSWGMTPVRWLLDQLNVRPDGEPPLCLIHATHLSASERMALAESPHIVGLCPSTEANLGDGRFPTQAFLSQGGRFAVGSDSHVVVDPAREWAALELEERLSRGARGCVDFGPDVRVGDGLLHHTVRWGAAALGQPAEGIAPGQRADFVRLSPDEPRFFGTPRDAIIDTLIFAAPRRPVAEVWVGGHRKVREGCHILRDEICREAARAMKFISSSPGS